MIKQLFRYGTLTIINQFLIFIGTFVAVEIFSLTPSLSYFIVISLVYIFSFFAFSRKVFPVNFDTSVMIRYVAAMFIFWIFNNIFFNIVIKYLHIQYLVAVIINIALFGLIRFFVYKNVVFKYKADQKKVI